MVDQALFTILVVDDNSDFLAILRELIELECPHFTVSTSCIGAEAVAIAQDLQPRAVLLDIDMPVMNGFDAALAIRRHCGDEAPLMISMSGGAHRFAAGGAASPFDHALRKPFDFEVLFGLLWAPARRRAITGQALPGSRRVAAALQGRAGHAAPCPRVRPCRAASSSSL